MSDRAGHLCEIIIEGEVGEVGEVDEIGEVGEVGERLPMAKAKAPV